MGEKRKGRKEEREGRAGDYSGGGGNGGGGVVRERRAIK